MPSQRAEVKVTENESQNSTLSCEETVKLLGIEIDYQLHFDIHISSICRKASQQNSSH
jgi:hypothetical protein